MSNVALNESRGILLGLLAVTVFSFTLPATRYVVQYFDPVFIGLGRAVVAAIIAAALLLLSKQPLPTWQQLRKLFIVSLGVVIGFPLLSSLSMQSLSAAHGGVVLGLVPLLTVMVTVLISNERPSQGFWLSAIVGSLLVMSFSLYQGRGEINLGDSILIGAALVAAMGYAVGGVLSKELGGRLSAGRWLSRCLLPPFRWHFSCRWMVHIFLLKRGWLFCIWH